MAAWVEPIKDAGQERDHQAETSTLDQKLVKDPPKRGRGDDYGQAHHEEKEAD